jgi:hypothetical protein
MRFGTTPVALAETSAIGRLGTEPPVRPLGK